MRHRAVLDASGTQPRFLATVWQGSGLAYSLAVIVLTDTSKNELVAKRRALCAFAISL